MTAGVLRPKVGRYRGVKPAMRGDEAAGSGEAGDGGGSVRLSRVAHPRFVLFIGLVVLAVPAGLPFLRPEEAVVYGFNIAALAFILACLPLWREDRPEALRARGARDDGGRAVLLVISTAVLAAVVAALAVMVQTREALTMPDLLQVMATLLLAWLFVNLIYAHHYGHLYYDRAEHGDAGGLEFPGRAAPIFSDFCYFAFCIGMTSAVSDVNITSQKMRRAVTLHGLLAFVFNLGVMALVINVLSGILSVS